jgi:hypothetical protein
MKSISIIIGLGTLMLTSCANKHDFWNISEFKIDNNALEDNEEIKIIYSSGSFDYNKDLEYYIHLIAVSQKTRDTVNILTLANPLITIENKDEVFNFFNQDNALSKLIQIDIESIKDISNINEINNKPTKKIEKVVRDPKFDHIAINQYPTIIGSIGNVIQNKE